ncbi:MAG TPA: cyclic nucleotide-binding domain-containing protein [Cyclobacteriaceae bacterium]
MVSKDQLRRLPFFQHLSEVDLEKFAKIAVTKQFDQNQEVVLQHSEARNVFFLIDGAVQFLMWLQEIEKNLLVGVTRSYGSLIGWSAFRAPYRYTTTVRTERSSTFYIISKSKFDEIVNQKPSIGYPLLQKVAIAAMERLSQSRLRLVGSKSNAEHDLGGDEDSFKSQIFENIAITSDLLRKQIYFDIFQDSDLELLAGLGRIITIEKGQLLLEEYQQAHHFYILLCGEVELSVMDLDSLYSNKISIRTINTPGYSIGWSAFVPPYLYHATATTLKKTTAIVFEARDLEEIARTNPRIGIPLMRRVLQTIGNRLRATRIRLIAYRYDEVTIAIKALLGQNASRLNVSSPLHKIPHFLANRLTLSDAFEVLSLVREQGKPLEQNLANLSLDLLEGIKTELKLYTKFQNIYETVANAPPGMDTIQIRNNCNKAFQDLFENTNYIIEGMKHLPEKPGNIIIMNHIVNNPENTLPNDFQLTLDSHFVSSMIVYEKYGETPIRVVRQSGLKEYGHKMYYDRLGYIYVRNKEIQELEESPTPRKFLKHLFLDKGKEILISGNNLMIAPEGKSYRTEKSPAVFKTGAFELAAYVEPEPMIIPIAVANFDKKITKTTLTAIIHEPFYLSDYVARPLIEPALSEFLLQYHKTFKKYVKKAIALAGQYKSY